MKLLIDTCVAISSEPTGADEIEPATEIAIHVQRTCHRLGGTIYIHPESLRELEHDPVPERRLMREILYQRYIILERPPRVSAQLTALIGSADPGSHDAVDDILIAAVAADAVDLLVTSDQGLLKKAVRAGLQDRIGSPGDILKLLEQQLPVQPAARPSVSMIRAHELEDEDPIFSSIRTEYGPEFDQWLAKCKREHRICWVIKKNDGNCAAVCIFKADADGDHGLTGRIAKICTFKAEYGSGYGELLLNSVFDYSFANGIDKLFVEVFPNHGDVIRLFRQFGFLNSGVTSRPDERVLVKALNCQTANRSQYSSLDYNLTFGPQRIMLDGSGVFLVPIRPEFHRALYPELELQPELYPGTTPWGNAIRKAYLCHSPTRSLPPGSLLLFYRSGDFREIRCVGVVEKTVKSSNPDQIIRLVGSRTVYPANKIEEMCRRKDVLAILFRHAFTLPEPWGRMRLVHDGIVKGAPQSIVKLSPEALPWLRRNLAMWL